MVARSRTVITVRDSLEDSTKPIFISNKIKLFIVCVLN